MATPSLPEESVRSDESGAISRMVLFVVEEFLRRDSRPGYDRDWEIPQAIYTSSLLGEPDKGYLAVGSDSFTYREQWPDVTIWATIFSKEESK